MEDQKTEKPATTKRNYNREKKFNPGQNFHKKGKMKGKGPAAAKVTKGPDLSGLSSDSRFILYYATGFKLLTMDQISEIVEALKEWKKFSD